MLYCTTLPCGGENCQLIILSIYLLKMRCKQKQIRWYCNAVKLKIGLIRGILISYRVILSKSWCTTLGAYSNLHGEGGGQKWSILALHNLWTTPQRLCQTLNSNWCSWGQLRSHEMVCINYVMPKWAVFTTPSKFRMENGFNVRERDSPSEYCHAKDVKL